MPRDWRLPWWNGGVREARRWVRAHYYPHHSGRKLATHYIWRHRTRSRHSADNCIRNNRDTAITSSVQVRSGWFCSSHSSKRLTSRPLMCFLLFSINHCFILIIFTYKLRLELDNLSNLFVFYCSYRYVLILWGFLYNGKYEHTKIKVLYYHKFFNFYLFIFSYIIYLFYFSFYFLRIYISWFL